MWRWNGTCIQEHWDAIETLPANATNPIALFRQTVLPFDYILLEASGACKCRGQQIPRHCDGQVSARVCYSSTRELGLHSTKLLTSYLDFLMLVMSYL
jgi:hypothetical protein